MPIINATSTPYDLTNVTAGGNILEFVQNVNNLTGQYFMLGMLLAGWVIMFVAMMKPQGNKDALLASSFMIAVMSIFFRTLEFITTTMTIIIILIFGLILVFLMWRKD